MGYRRPSLECCIKSPREGIVWGHVCPEQEVGLWHPLATVLSVQASRLRVPVGRVPFH